MAFNIGIELRGGELALDLVGFKFRHVHAIGGEAAHGLVEGGGNIPYTEDKAGDDRPGSQGRILCFSRKHHKTRGVMGLVLNILAQDVEAVNLRRKPGSNDGAVLVLAFAQFTGGSRRVNRDHRFQTEFTDELAALAQRMDMAVDGFDVGNVRARHGEELVMDAKKIFADHMEVGGRQEMVDISDTARHGIIDGDHGKGRLAIFHGLEGILEGAAGQRLETGIGLDAGDM